MFIDQLREFYQRVPVQNRVESPCDDDRGKVMHRTLRGLWEWRVFNPRTMVVNADAVATYFDSIAHTLEATIESGIYNAAPPAPQCWIEWAPKNVPTWFPDARVTRPKRVCVYVESLDMAHWRKHDPEAQTKRTPYSGHPAFSLMTPEMENQLVEARWLLHLDTAMSMTAEDSAKLDLKGWGYRMSLEGIYLTVDQDGSLKIWGHNAPDEWYEGAATDEEVHEWFRVVWALVGKIPLLTFSFLNTKNVTLHAHDYHAKQQKARTRAGKPPFVRYHTLHVHPPALTRTASGAASESNDTGKPLHQVRGHFADYRHGAGLFGKYREVIWVPQHIRGCVANGLVKKNYVVHEPTSPQSVA